MFAEKKWGGQDSKDNQWPCTHRGKGLLSEIKFALKNRLYISGWFSSVEYRKYISVDLLKSAFIQDEDLWLLEISRTKC